MQTLLCVDASFHLGLAFASFFSLHVTRLTEPLLIFDINKSFRRSVVSTFRKWKIFRALSRFTVKLTLISFKFSVISSVTSCKSKTLVSVTSSSFSSSLFSFFVIHRRLNYINILSSNVKFSKTSKTSKILISHSYSVNLQFLFNEKNIYDEILLYIYHDWTSDCINFKWLHEF